jgi:hypothetical protein
LTSSNSRMRCCRTTERVDCRVPSAGRAGFMFSLSFSEASIFTAGEAGIVLSRFLPSETPALRKEDVKGLVPVRGVVLVVVFEAGVADALLFVGLSELTRATDFFSEVGEG